MAADSGIEVLATDQRAAWRTKRLPPVEIVAGQGHLRWVTSGTTTGPVRVGRITAPHVEYRSST